MPVNGKERTGEDEKKRKEEKKNRNKKRCLHYCCHEQVRDSIKVLIIIIIGILPVCMCDGYHD